MDLKAIRAAAALGLMLALCACGREQQNTAVSEPEPDPAAALVISELMPSNHSTLADGDGSFPDWIELYNSGTEEISTAGLRITCGEKEEDLPEQTLGPGEYAVFFCTEAKLPADGGTVSLLSDAGALDTLTYPEADGDISCIRSETGTADLCTLPTPGYENTETGYLNWQEALTLDSPLIISEVMVYNEWFPLQKWVENPEYYDWIELKNVSDTVLNLSDYCLSDLGEDRGLYPLPDQELKPGETCTIWCSDEESVGAPFALNVTYDCVYLTGADGELADFMTLRGLPYGGSCGREDGKGGTFYYSDPTPGADNAGGCRLISGKPTSVEADGVFNGVTGVTVTLQAAGTIHYTTDGSTPDAEDPVYSEPLTLTETTVLRAVSIEDGKLPSEAAAFSYILNEDLTLPVVSVVMNPTDFTGINGIYSLPLMDWEKAATVEYFGDDGSFSIDCGIKIHGGTSREKADKKSFKLVFRDRYDGKLDYDLFDGDVTEFSSLLLRSAMEDGGGTQMRDVLLHKLAAECSSSLPTEDYRYVILFINGEYWGIYAIREAHSADYYADHYGYDADTVSAWRQEWPLSSVIGDVYTLAVTKGMSDPDNYAYAAAHIDMESLVTWLIIQAYSCNQDLGGPNVRFYYSSEDQVMRYALVDLDATLYPVTTLCNPPLLFGGSCYSDLAGCLTTNADFRALLLQRLSEYLQGPLSDENVLSEIDSLAAEVEPEIARDAERWGRRASSFTLCVNNYRTFVNDGTSRAKKTVSYFNSVLYITEEEWETWFSWLDD